MRGRRGAGSVASVAAVALALGLTAGCSGGGDEDAAAPTPSVTRSPAPTTLTCDDTQGDNVDPTLDLVAVRLARAGENVRVVFDTTEPPGDDPLRWVVGFVSANGRKSVELTTDRRKNGDLVHAIVVDGDRRPVMDPVRVTAEGMTTVFPVDPIDDLGAGVRWYASIAVDGEDVDFCPGGPEVREVLDTVPLTLPDRW